MTIGDSRLPQRFWDKEKARGERRQAKEEAKAKELETKPVQPSFF